MDSSFSTVFFNLLYTHVIVIILKKCFFFKKKNKPYATFFFRSQPRFSIYIPKHFFVSSHLVITSY